MCKAYDNASNQRDEALARVRELEAELQRFRNLRLDVERQRDSTEAEQAVLDAAAWGHPDMLRKVIKDYGYSAWVHMVATAELARRGLK